MRLIAIAILILTTSLSSACASTGKSSSLGTHKGYHPGQKKGNPVREAFNTFRR